MAGDIAHPLIVPLPRLAAPVARAVRYLALARLRAMWGDGRLDLELPSGDSVMLGSGAPAARVRIHDDGLFVRLLLRGELGAGEAFVAGEWTSDDLVGAARAFLRATSARGIESPLTRVARLPALVRHRRAANTRAGSERNVHAHYDLGNAFYRLFLDDDTLAYSCAIWPDASLAPSALANIGSGHQLPNGGAARRAPDSKSGELAEAQRRKLDRLCDWLALSPRDHLLEIGCGWGGMAIHAARTRGCRVTAITVSREQHELAAARVAAAGLADRVTIAYRDYRDVSGTYDKIVSIEMLEQVGLEHLPRFFATCARALAPGGRFALQTITMPDERFAAYRRGVDWMQTYIFPGTLIPSLGAIRAACTPLSILRADDIGPSYVPTLRVWRERFLAALPGVRTLGFDAPFVRTWLLYLAFSEAAFAEKTLSDHQLLLG